METTRIVTFMLVDTPSQYNVIMGRPSLSEYASIIIAHLMMKCPVEDDKQRIIGVGEVHGDNQILEDAMWHLFEAWSSTSELGSSEVKRTRRWNFPEGKVSCRVLRNLKMVN